MDEVLGLELVDRIDMPLFVRFDIRLKAERFVAKTLFDHLFEADERTAADKQDICRIELLKILLRMLAAAARRDICDRAFEYLQQACWTPSPDTSRVIDGLSSLRQILSISSM